MSPLVLLFALQLCWQPPTENVDGTPLTDLAGYRIYWGDASRDYYGMQLEPDAAATCAEVIIDPGTYYFAMTAFDADDNESGFSNEVTKTEVDRSPLPPVIIQQAEMVFTVVKQPNTFLLLPIGVVPAGTPCDMNNSTNGHGAVPTDAVIWTSESSSRPIVVVAKCDG